MAAVELSMQIDPAFAEYAPVYPTEFDVGDIKGELESLLLISTTTLPDGSKRELMKAFITKLARLGRIPADRVKALLDEADTADTAPDLSAFTGAPRPQG